MDMKKSNYQEEVSTLLEATSAAQKRQAFKDVEHFEKNEEHFRLVAQSATDAIISINSSGKVIFWNKAAESIFGYSANQIIGKPLALIIPPSFRSKHRNALNKLVAAGKPKLIGKTVELFARKKDKSELPIELSLSQWKTDEGIFFTGIIRDITEHKQIEMENVRLYNIEHRIAETLQKSLLTMPRNIKRISFGHLYQASTIEEGSVGGDFYDIFELNDGKVCFFIGDISGKGIEAAALISTVKNTIRAYAFEDYPPDQITSKTNRVFLKATDPSIFATVFLGIFDPNTSVLSYCSAGHPPAILIKEGSQVECSTKNCPAIGIFEGVEYACEKIAIDNGATIVLYTDGVTEARSNRDFFGEERLLRFIKDSPNLSAQDIPSRIFDEIMSFSKGMLRDDVAILAVSPI